jgi:hypothetical protein
MSGGQYELKRRKEAESYRSQSDSFISTWSIGGDRIVSRWY